MATENRDSSFTAYGCAYSRIFTGIFPARQIFNSLLKNGNPAELRAALDNIDLYAEFAPYFEARYRLAEKIISESGLRQTVEIASGLSPQFYSRTLDPANRHIEIDLPENMQVKRQIVEDLITRKVVERMASHFLVSGNAVDGDDFQRVINCLRAEPTAFGIFGLLRYVSPQDRQILFHLNIVPVLKRCGGMILTSDIELQSEANATPESIARYDDMVKVCGFDVRPNLFFDLEDATRFFSDLGGTLQERSLHEVVDELVSPKPLGLVGPEATRFINQYHRCFVVNF